VKPASKQRFSSNASEVPVPLEVAASGVIVTAASQARKETPAIPAA
jgi:hypothetical protein